MIVVMMGVSGSGKSTIGTMLASQLGWHYIEADDLHPAANVEKMHKGIPLNDDDRKPWLAALRDRIDMAIARGESVVVACSALKHNYQDYLDHHDPSRVHYVYLHGSEELIAQRLAARKGHFMNPGLLHSQFEILEPPENAVWIEIDATPEEIVADVRRELQL
jgi:gluconokinase